MAEKLRKTILDTRELQLLSISLYYIPWPLLYLSKCFSCNLLGSRICGTYRQNLGVNDRNFSFFFGNNERKLWDLLHGKQLLTVEKINSGIFPSIFVDSCMNEKCNSQKSYKLIVNHKEKLACMNIDRGFICMSASFNNRPCIHHFMIQHRDTNDMRSFLIPMLLSYKLIVQSREIIWVRVY